MLSQGHHNGVIWSHYLPIFVNRVVTFDSRYCILLSLFGLLDCCDIDLIPHNDIFEFQFFMHASHSSIEGRPAGFMCCWVVLQQACSRVTVGSVCCLQVRHHHSLRSLTHSKANLVSGVDWRWSMSVHS